MQTIDAPRKRFIFLPKTQPLALNIYIVSGNLSWRLDLNIDKIRQDFPALENWTYLDTSFVGLYPRQVRLGYEEFLNQWMEFKVSESKTILEEWLDKTNKVREDIASFIGVRSSEVAFTSCTGSGLNIVVNGLEWRKGDNVVFPNWEHNPLYTTTLRKYGVEARPVSICNGRIDMDDLEKKIDDNTKLVQVSQVSYVNGYRVNLREVAEITHEHGGKLLVDSTQAVGTICSDYRRDDVDFVSAAPYKFLMGPAGLAFLYVKEENIGDLTPDRVGWKNQMWEGDKAEKLSKNLETAEKFEYGTIHFEGVYGLEKSIEYLNELNPKTVEKRDLELSTYLWNKLNEIEAKMYTPEGTESPIVSFYEGKATEFSSWLMTRKVKVTGREAHGGHIRVSPHFYNTKNDIDIFIKKLKEWRRIS